MTYPYSVLVALAVLVAGCAILIQTRTEKKCFPYWSHICHSLHDRD